MLRKFYFYIEDDKMNELLSGNRLEASIKLHKGSCTGNVPVINVFNRQSRKHAANVLVKQIEHGWLKEGAKNWKCYQSVPKVLGVAKATEIMKRGVQEGMEGLL